ncbi:glycosyltransferase family 57 protein [Pseudocercospora fijiensis CIRAD86]|uniref:Alpha-1,3-glucosyltransferase n=1 Tax=Pseudocercospora fijiensis (strain CIRAD86) TaxID=383855 RepID=N1Q8U0_PSEFD|nr:glycosyltransferase family 57 protein [Pseudocercospora fijiensis CIRAD86]EME89310.1 glycosyltransferase family 57 protein [Pseudocercospora fijiensis CIRAD86]
MAPSPSHRPRKRRKADILASASSSNGTVVQDAVTKREAPSFPLVAFFWPAKGTLSSWITIPCILMVIGLFRWCTAIWPYSGFQKPPMHGDFEAQRHWMELTIHLPTTHWYFHDLQWWGLDYPPLTAYHSWLLGTIGSYINPSWFALYLSHGLDEPDLKVFMRATVYISEHLVYIPAVIICVRHLARLHNMNTWEASIALTAILMQPATMLIDHGHFQYNTVMQGLFVASLSNMLAGRAMWACLFFVGALGFKQMALFWAPAVAAYLAGSCLLPKVDPIRFLGIATATIGSLALLFLPLLLGTFFDTYRQVPLPSDISLPPLLNAIPFSLSEKAWYYPYLLQLTQSIHRIFPFSRGLFEDKVANIWCAVHASGLHKLHQYDQGLLSKAALAVTLASIIPPCLIIFLRPRKELLPLAFATTSWGFFLCSYQVHEKNVLLPLLPMTLLLATEDGMKPKIRAWVGYANLLASWTLFPLLAKDELKIPYVVLTSLWAYLMGLPPFSIGAYTTPASEGGVNIVTKLIHVGTFAAALAWHGLELFVQPPAGKPDLWVVANVVLGCAGFGICYLWCLWNLTIDSALFNFGGRKQVREEKKTQ